MDEVEAYLREQHAEAAELALWTRERVQAAEPDFAERVYRGWRGIGFRHPEAGYVCAIYPREGSVVLLFEHGAAMSDPDGVLEGTGSQTRYLRIDREDDSVAATIARLVEQAVAEQLLYRATKR